MNSIASFHAQLPWHFKLSSKIITKIGNLIFQYHCFLKCTSLLLASQSGVLVPQFSNIFSPAFLNYSTFSSRTYPPSTMSTGNGARKPANRSVAIVACTSCRSSKIKCMTTENSKTCLACQRHKTPCVFEKRRVRGPGKRNKKSISNDAVYPYHHRDIKIGSLINKLPTASVTGGVSSGEFASEEPLIYSNRSSASLPASSKRMTSKIATLQQESTQPFSPEFPLDESAQGKQRRPLLCLSQCIPKPLLSTDLLCPRPVFNEIMRVYLNIVYPIIPAVHRPSFVADLNNHRERSDPLWFGLLMALCGIVLGTIPRKFFLFQRLAIQATGERMPYHNASEMYERCLELVTLVYNPMNTSPSYIFWAIPGLLTLADGYVWGESTRSAVFADLSQGALRALNLGSPNRFDGLDCIETELRKRAYCFTMCHVMHVKTSLFNFSLMTSNFFGVENISDIMPVEVDDEYITANEILPQPPNKQSLMTGFIANHKVFCSLDGLGDSAYQSSVKDMSLNRTEQNIVEEMFSLCNSTLEDLPPCLQAWKGIMQEEDIDGDWLSRHFEETPNNNGWYLETDQLLEKQLESQRANIHISALWAQDCLLQRLIKLRRLAGFSDQQSETIISQKQERICINLLNILGRISLNNLEPNGLSLIAKIRTIAASVMSGSARDEAVMSRAGAYVSKFIDFMIEIELHRGRESEEETWKELNWYDRVEMAEFVQMLDGGSETPVELPV